MSRSDLGCTRVQEDMAWVGAGAGRIYMYDLACPSEGLTRLEYRADKPACCGNGPGAAIASTASREWSSVLRCGG
jgi:hypothetical protein